MAATGDKINMRDSAVVTWWPTNSSVASQIKSHPADFSRQAPASA